jgi:transcriptional regulatory protein AMDR
VDKNLANAPKSLIQECSPTNLETVRAACVNCHDRKVRCDAHKRGFPCSNCITSKRPNCRRHEKKRRPQVRSPGNFIPIRRRSQNRPPQVAPPAENGTSAEAAPAAAKSTQAAPNKGDAGAGNELVEFVDQEDISSRSVLRGFRLTYVGKDVSNINFLVRQREGEEMETVHHLSSDRIASQLNPHKGERIPREAFVLPDQALADQLIETYFTHVNSWCPIVDEDTFMGQYRKGDPADPPSLLLLQAILLVGAHVSQERPDRDKLKASFFHRAKMLFDGRLEKNRDFVVQSALLLSWYSDGAEDVGANAWHWVGIAARTATGLGMHRDVGTANRLMITHPDGHTWRRIWWILVQFDVTVALSYGRPQAMYFIPSPIAVPILTTEK